MKVLLNERECAFIYGDRVIRMLFLGGGVFMGVLFFLNVEEYTTRLTISNV